MTEPDTKSEYDVRDYRQIQRVISDPVGQPVHRTQIDAEKRHEEATPAYELSSEYQWYYLGFAYCLIKVDRSLFEVFQAAGDLSIPVKTHRSDKPLVQVAGADFAKNPWAYIIQGIPVSIAPTFTDFVASYQFRKIDTGDSWCCHFQPVRIADPFFQGFRRGVDVMVALPANLTKKRRFCLLSEQTLLLETPTFGPTNG